MVESITQEELLEYDEEKIIESLIVEIDCPEDIAKKVAKSITRKLNKLELQTISPSLIRSFVNVELYNRGFDKELISDKNIIIPFYDIKQIIEHASLENGNTTHSPESINLNLAEKILKQYALKEIFPKEISKAHLEGKLHLHDLGMIDRFYCSGHSPEYVKKHGVKNIPSIPSNSAPANSAWVLARHISSLTQFFSGLFAGAIGWEGINIFFAPMIRGWKYKNIKQLAQTLIFDLSQLAGARGGQISFTDFNVYIDIPEHYKNVLAMGNRGKYIVENINTNEITYVDTQEEALQLEQKEEMLALRYKDYDYESKLFLKAILEVTKEGDMNGMPFVFPKINLHINDNTFKYEDSKELLMLASEVSSEKGCPYFIFDRNAYNISQCCRLVITFTEEDMKDLEHPEELRFVGLQNVSISLPNASLQCPNEDDFYKEISYRMDLASQAHIIRRDYVWGLTKLENSPLKFYAEGIDGKPYIKLDRASYLMGLVGLNECVKNLTGEEMHESKNAFQKGLEIISYMNIETKRLSEKYGINIKLEESPAESTAGRFAKLDVKKYGDKAFVKRNQFGEYYSNSVHFATDSDVDYITRLIDQSKFHNLVEAGSMIHIWTGEKKPKPASIYKLIEKTWYKTDCIQWVLSPEYTTCYDCSKTFNGLSDNCPSCNSENIVNMTRITGYYVPVHKFNKSKKAELLDRKREEIK